MAIVFAQGIPTAPFSKTLRHRLTASLIVWLLGAGGASAANYTLAIEPSDSPSRLQQLYRPLADYLSRSTGESFEIELAPNFTAFWQRVKKGGAYDFIIDSAHMTDYRIQEQKFIPLMRGAGNIRFSVVALKSGAHIKPDQLVGKNVACTGSPSMPFLLFQKLFPNPLRQPMILPVNGASEAIDRLRSGEAVAAVIPSRVAADTDDVIVIGETDAVPNLALSAAPSVPAHLRNAVANALARAESDPEIAKLLSTLGIPTLEPAKADDFKGEAALLDGMWGF